MHREQLKTFAVVITALGTVLLLAAAVISMIYGL
jgi:hypothetical protein